MSIEPVRGAAEKATEAAAETTELTSVLGANLRRLRIRRGLALERLARASGVSRATLGQIELGQSRPTMNDVWKIARSLSVPFSALISHCVRPRTALLPRPRAEVLASSDGKLISRALFSYDDARRVELNELRLRSQGRELARAMPLDTHLYSC